jgi:hypothetical protein
VTRGFLAPTDEVLTAVIYKYVVYFGASTEISERRTGDIFRMEE